MIKYTYIVLLFFALSNTFTGCRDDKSAKEKMEDGIEEVKEGAEDVGDDVKEGAEEVKDEIDDHTDDN